MTDEQKLYNAFGCGIDSFCAHSGGYHACCYDKNHPNNKIAPNICINGSHFSISSRIDPKTILETLYEIDNDLI